MNKVGGVITVVFLVSITYLFLLVIMPILNTFAASANATMAGTSNMSNYPGTGEAIIALPWALFFVPAVLGTGAILLILRGEIWHQ